MSETDGSSGVTSSHLAGPSEVGRLAWGFRTPVRSCPCFLSWKGLKFVLGSWLAVDRGWDRTSVCCYGCRTLEGDGWIIMANAAEQVSGCPEVAQDPCPPSAVEGTSPCLLVHCRPCPQPLAPGPGGGGSARAILTFAQ